METLLGKTEQRDQIEPTYGQKYSQKIQTGRVGIHAIKMLRKMATCSLDLLAAMALVSLKDRA